MISPRKVLIVDDMHESIIPLLKEAGFEPNYHPEITRDEILKRIKEYFGLVIRSKTPVDAPLLEKAPNIRFVARAGAGMDKVDISYLESKAIVAINAPEGNRDALGEHTLGMLLGILHRINHAHHQISNGIWDREGNRGIELRKKVVGIYGVGNMGMAFARKLAGLDCRVVGYDKFNHHYSAQCGGCIEELSLEDFMSQVEILSIHVPLTDETRYLFDEQYLGKFPNLKIILNTARGKVLRTSSVINMLKSGTLFGVGLDVLENEKLHTYTEYEKKQLEELMSFPNVLVTPHVGGWTFESYERINKVICKKLKDHFG